MNTLFIDSTIKKTQTKNKNPTDLKMDFPPTIKAQDLILKPLDGKKPRRSPNAFIIYRKLFVQHARENGYNLQMTEISKTASKSWENERDEVKTYYKRLAREAYKYRSEMFPKIDRRKKRQQWNIVSFKPTTDEIEYNNYNESSTHVQTPSSIEDISNLKVNPIDEFPIDEFPIVFNNNQTQNNFDTTSSITSPDILAQFADPGATVTDLITWSNLNSFASPDLSTGSDLSPVIDENNEYSPMNISINMTNNNLFPEIDAGIYSDYNELENCFLDTYLFPYDQDTPSLYYMNESDYYDNNSF